MLIDARPGICRDMCCGDMCTSIRTAMCIGICIDMWRDMHVDTCIDMRIDMCTFFDQQEETYSGVYTFCYAAPSCRSSGENPSSASANNAAFASAIADLTYAGVD